MMTEIRSKKDAAAAAAVVVVVFFSAEKKKRKNRIKYQHNGRCVVFPLPLLIVFFFIWSFSLAVCRFAGRSCVRVR